MLKFPTDYYFSVNTCFQSGIARYSTVKFDLLHVYISVENIVTSS